MVGQPCAGKERGRRSHRILVVDDDPESRALLTRLLAGRYDVLAVEDGAAAVAWAAANVARFGGDPARLTIAGHSAGAHIAAMLALDPRWLRAAGARPVAAAVGLAGPYDFHPFTSTAAIAAFAAAPDPLSTQPIAFARGDAPPMLLATGDVDTVVRPRNSVRLAEALGAAGAPVSLRRYPGVTHSGILRALSRPFRSLAPVLGDAAAFLLAATERR